MLSCANINGSKKLNYYEIDLYSIQKNHFGISNKNSFFDCQFIYETGDNSID